jgi:hypothetical protein
MIEHLQESQIPQQHFANIQAVLEHIDPTLNRRIPVSGVFITSSWGN